MKIKIQNEKIVETAGAYSNLVKKGSGLSRKIDKKSMSKYNLKQYNFNIQHLHVKAVDNSKIYWRQKLKNTSKIDGLFKINQLMLHVKLAEQS